MDAFRQMTFGGLDEEKPKPVSFSFTLTLDRIFIFAIIGLILLVLVFSMGVEQGKKTAAQRIEHAFARANTMIPPAQDTVVMPQTRVATVQQSAVAVPPVTPMIPKTVPVKKVIVPDVKPAVAQVVPVKKAVTPVPTGKKTVFCIQTGSYSKQDDAARFAAKLKTGGYQAYVTKSGDYYAVLVGDFLTKAQADKALGSLKKTYNDAYIKRKER